MAAEVAFDVGKEQKSPQDALSSSTNRYRYGEPPAHSAENNHLRSLSLTRRLETGIGGKVSLLKFWRGHSDHHSLPLC